MSWSLQLSGGDFAASGARLNTVTAANKLVQDLRCLVLERMGTDDMHQDFGSLIDGGILPDGTVVPSLIATSSFTAAANAIQSEMQRLASAYRAQQLVRAKDDQTSYNRVTLTPAEVLLAISDITFTQQQDTLLTNVQLSTAAGTPITTVFPLAAS